MTTLACKYCGESGFKSLFSHETVCDEKPKQKSIRIPKSSAANSTLAAKKGTGDGTVKSNWRDQHSAFINSIRIANQMKEIENAGGAHVKEEIAAL